MLIYERQVRQFSALTKACDTVSLSPYVGAGEPHLSQHRLYTTQLWVQQAVPQLAPQCVDTYVSRVQETPLSVS